MDRVYKGAELEVRAAGHNGEWISASQACEYRVKPKPEVVQRRIHKLTHGKAFNVLCGKWNIGDGIDKESQKETTCPDCLAKMCKYPGLADAIKKREEFFVKVRPEQSREVQELLFSLNVFWAGKDEKHVHWCDYAHIIVCFSKYPKDKRKYWFGANGDKNGACDFPEFHISTDSFNAPLPEWVKVGAKCFYNSHLHEIISINHSVEIKSLENGNISHVHSEHLAPAVKSVTYDYLAKLMPFAVKSKNTGIVYSVEKIDPDGGKVFIACGNGNPHFTKLEENYLMKTAAETEFHEIGEWVKA